MKIGITSLILATLGATSAFQPSARTPVSTCTSNTLYNDNDISNMATARFPTSPEDQVRQAAISIKEATKDGKTRHALRLLLPIIGATELDDWPGGARQMMEAASPLAQDIMKLQVEGKQQKSAGDDNDNDDDIDDDDDSNNAEFKVAESVIDESDGVRALFGQAPMPEDDSCSVLLPSADTVPKLQELDGQVGAKRNLVFINSQWRRKTDFGMAFFGNNREDKIKFVEGFEPTFHCSNVMVEGDIIRILRTYPGPWRVYLRVANPEDETDIDWVEIGSKELVMSKTPQWLKDAKDGDKDGGKLFDYGIPLYGQIEEMITSREGYVPKSLSERAAAAFTFIKDTL